MREQFSKNNLVIWISDKAVAYKCDLAIKDLAIKDLAKQNLRTRKQNPYKRSLAKQPALEWECHVRQEYMGTFSAEFTNNSDTSEDPSFELACEKAVEGKNMDQSSDSTITTGLQEQMASLQQLVKQQAEQLSLLQSEPQPVAQPAAIHPRPILPDPDTFDGSDRALYPEFQSKLDAKLTLDQAALGSYCEMLWYAYYCLSDAAAGQILPWMKIYA